MISEDEVIIISSSKQLDLNSSIRELVYIVPVLCRVHVRDGLIVIKRRAHKERIIGIQAKNAYTKRKSKTQTYLLYQPIAAQIPTIIMVDLF